MITKWIKFALVCVVTAGTFTLANASPTAEEKKLIEELKKTYPLNVCVVSGEKLGSSMGAPIDYLYTQKVDGKDTTRLVRFCCPSCIKKFTANPDKYIKILDAELAKKTAETTAPSVAPTTAPSSDAHANHHM